MNSPSINKNIIVLRYISGKWSRFYLPEHKLNLIIETKLMQINDKDYTIDIVKKGFLARKFRIITKAKIRTNPYLIIDNEDIINFDTYMILYKNNKPISFYQNHWLYDLLGDKITEGTKLWI